MSSQQSIAHYKILSKLGQGGMGAVYRATDTKLNREVAIKILPDVFAADPDRFARFTREAQVLAALNHPNIAAIYGVEERALVMELVEGEDLRGPLPIETALQYARQIADAFEAAHEKGIVHRDLKPANIKVTPQGVVKVLDFGLAVMTQGPAAAASDPANSPTLTMRATQAGIIIGTAAYMSPEQAAGKTVDRRADVWSFGAVLWEMLTGQRLFDGETVSHTLADVLRREIDFAALPAETPPAVRALLRRCLDRNVRNRLRDIGEARIVLENPLAPPLPAVQPARRTHGTAWVASTAVFAITAAILGWVHFRQGPVLKQLLRFSVSPPDKGTFTSWIGLSPDGHHLGFTALGADGISRLWIRSLDLLEARQIPGTDGTVTFFWSPDNRFVVFQSGGKLKKIDISGGPAQILCDISGALLGGSWNSGGVILFGLNNGPIMQVSNAGGVAVLVTKVEPSNGEQNHSDPIFLPDGRHFLYFARSAEHAGVYVGSVGVKPNHRTLHETWRGNDAAPQIGHYNPRRVAGLWLNACPPVHHPR
jgi:serine/threonine-protein kinase